MKIATYETDLSDHQWHLLRRFLPAAKKRGRPRTALREVLNGILYLVKTGAQWRLLPKNFPPWQTVYHHFRQWSRNGLLARLNHRLRAKVRQAVGKHAPPSAASLDSQTVRASASSAASSSPVGPAPTMSTRSLRGCATYPPCPGSHLIPGAHARPRLVLSQYARRCSIIERSMPSPRLEGSAPGDIRGNRRHLRALVQHVGQDPHSRDRQGWPDPAP